MKIKKHINTVTLELSGAVDTWTTEDLAAYCIGASIVHPDEYITDPGWMADRAFMIKAINQDLLRTSIANAIP